MKLSVESFTQPIDPNEIIARVDKSFASGGGGGGGGGGGVSFNIGSGVNNARNSFDGIVPYGVARDFPIARITYTGHGSVTGFMMMDEIVAPFINPKPPHNHFLGGHIRYTLIVGVDTYETFDWNGMHAANWEHSVMLFKQGQPAGDFDIILRVENNLEWIDQDGGPNQPRAAEVGGKVLVLEM